MILLKNSCLSKNNSGKDHQKCLAIKTNRSWGNLYRIKFRAGFARESARSKTGGFSAESDIEIRKASAVCWGWRSILIS